jgi:phenylacetate-coenzyme A ligase PaaK-like adenylate-forming protein
VSVLGTALPPFDAWRSCALAADVAAASLADDAGLDTRRRARLTALLAAVARDSPLYRRLLRGREMSTLSLQSLPVMHKAQLMARFADWVCDPDLRLAALRAFVADPTRIAAPFLGRYTVWESSGSSGEPGVFVQDSAAMATYDALEGLRRPALRPFQGWWDPWGMQARTAFVGAIGGHFASIVSIERLRRLNPLLGARMLAVSLLLPMPELVARLNAWGPTSLATYPSAAVLLAAERRAGRLRVGLNEVWLGGETVTPSMRRFVADAFDCPVASSYGASEFLSLASECRLGQLHLNSDWAILESVDQRGAAVPPGIAGATTLLTNLANHVQPLIRYDLGDRVTLHATSCACGSHLPRIEVEGRSDDTLCFSAAKDRLVQVSPLALSTVLEDEAGLFDFQLVQQGPRDLLLRSGLQGGTARDTLQRAGRMLATFLAEQGAPGLRIRCRCGEPAQPGRTGKIKRIVTLSRRTVAPCHAQVPT